MIVPEANGQNTISCILCHTNADPADVLLIINGWRTEFGALDSIAAANVARVAELMQNAPNPAWQATLQEAQANLAYAESDESGGIHNHPYLMALLQDANQKALSIPILTVTRQGASIIISWSGSGTLQSTDSMNGVSQ